jgi:hypothetical protein
MKIQRTLLASAILSAYSAYSSLAFAADPTPLQQVVVTATPLATRQ